MKKIILLIVVLIMSTTIVVAKKPEKNPTPEPTVSPTAEPTNTPTPTIEPTPISTVPPTEGNLIIAGGFDEPNINPWLFNFNGVSDQGPCTPGILPYDGINGSGCAYIWLNGSENITYWTQTVVNLDPSKIYQASVYIKGDSGSSEFGIGVIDNGTMVFNSNVLTYDYEKVELSFVPVGTSIEIILYAKDGYGHAYFDEVVLIEE